MGEVIHWRKVTKDEFYAAIGPQDVSPRIVGNWPYTTHMATPRGEVRGKIVDTHAPATGARVDRSYYLPEAPHG